MKHWPSINLFKILAIIFSKLFVVLYGCAEVKNELSIFRIPCCKVKHFSREGKVWTIRWLIQNVSTIDVLTGLSTCCRAFSWTKNNADSCLIAHSDLFSANVRFKRIKLNLVWFRQLVYSYSGPFWFHRYLALVLFRFIGRSLYTISLWSLSRIFDMQNRLKLPNFSDIKWIQLHANILKLLFG